MVHWRVFSHWGPIFAISSTHIDPQDTTNGLSVDFVPPPCYPTEGCETGQPVDVELFDASNDPVATLVGGFTYQASECQAVTGCATSGEFLTEIAGAVSGIGANGFIVNSDDFGSAGFEFEVYETIEITHFGAYDFASNGFNGDYVSIKLWKDSDQSLIHQETLFGDSPVNNNDLKVCGKWVAVVWFGWKHPLTLFSRSTPYLAATNIVAHHREGRLAVH